MNMTRITLITLALALGVAHAISPTPRAFAMVLGNPLDGVMYPCADDFAAAAEASCFITDVDPVDVRASINAAITDVAATSWFAPWQAVEDRALPGAWRVFHHVIDGFGRALMVTLVYYEDHGLTAVIIMRVD
jgi:hypothetical protein